MYANRVRQTDHMFICFFFSRHNNQNKNGEMEDQVVEVESSDIEEDGLRMTARGNG